MEQGAALELETAVLRAINFGAGQIGRQQIGGELHPVKVALDALAEYLDCARLGQPGRALHQQVAVGEYRDQQSLDQPLLADDLGADGLL